jgi:hypothetical protein
MNKTKPFVQIDHLHNPAERLGMRAAFKHHQFVERMTLTGHEVLPDKPYEFVDPDFGRAYFEAGAAAETKIIVQFIGLAQPEFPFKVVSRQVNAAPG